MVNHTGPGHSHQKPNGTRRLRPDMIEVVSRIEIFGTKRSRALRVVFTFDRPP
jgi:hypothetical protein